MSATLIAVAGCQSTPNKAGVSAESTRNEAWSKTLQETEMLPEFERRSVELGTEMGRFLVDLCTGRMKSEPLDECFHRQMLLAFDEHGAVAEHCPLNPDIDLDFQCIGLSALAYGLAQRAGGRALETFDWSDLEASTTAASVQIVSDQVEQCLSNGSASDPTDCVLAQVGKFLGLSQEDLQPCEGIVDDEELAGCFGQAYGYKELVAAFARMRQVRT